MYSGCLLQGLFIYVQLIRVFTNEMLAVVAFWPKLGVLDYVKRLSVVNEDER
jgi:hypothetical protein